jgi:putative FmdB family regulatory protein
MPIYEYRCPACSHRYETLTSRTDRDPPCPRCGATRVERVPSAFAVVSTHGEAPLRGPCGSDDCACRRPID